ncbi:TetR/AcrR family transcriptional regulator [Streptomyces sp. TRM70308]|uniref:TetR/AcrR family transcriptional regulator n=1 Tax=Streptomyces sp. TRM70308 TaxID=3131932 RepID=UPI003CFF7B58
MTEREALGLRERKKRATRAALAEAAVRLAVEHGAENVTVEAISQAAGVSPRTFFNYFDSHDDAFVMLDAEVGARVRRAVLDAPEDHPPLVAVRDALAAELVDVEQRHEVWELRAQVLQRSPHLLARSLGAHMADEEGLALAIAQRMASEPRASEPRAAAPPASEPRDAAALELYPRLLAAMSATAVRVAVQHWCARRRPERAFSEVFRRVFDQLAAGLTEPVADSHRKQDP